MNNISKVIHTKYMWVYYILIIFNKQLDRNNATNIRSICSKSIHSNFPENPIQNYANPLLTNYVFQHTGTDDLLKIFKLLPIHSLANDNSIYLNVLSAPINKILKLM